jgi:hypothetical protein
MKYLILSLLLCQLASAADQWLVMSTTKEARVEIKIGSCKFVMLNTELWINYACVERVSVFKENSAYFSYVAINTQNCQEGVGEIYNLQFNHSIITRNQVVSGGQNIGSNLFDYLCKISRNPLEQIPKQ